MRKTAALALVAAALTLAGCSGAPAPTDKPSLLVWVDATREPAAQAYVASVGDSANVTVEVYNPGELKTKIALFNQTNQGWPDVVFAGVPQDIAELSDPSNGYAAPLDDLVSEEVLDGFGTANDWCIIEGQVYCLKNDLSQTVLWYDTVLFEELGLTVPTTMEEFAAEAMKLEGTGYIAGAIGDGSFDANFLQSSGCPTTDAVDRTNVRIDGTAEECTRVADLLQPLVDAKVLDTRTNFDAGFIADVVKAGRVAMTFGASWFGDFVIRPEESWGIPAGRIAAAPMPIWSGESVNYSGAWGGGVFIVSSHSSFPQAAADAAVFMATDIDLQAAGVTFPAYGPANEAWAERISGDSYYAADVYPALADSASKINPASKPVRYDFEGSVGKVLQTGINENRPLREVILEFTDTLAQLAPASGYTVVK